MLLAHEPFCDSPARRPREPPPADKLAISIDSMPTSARTPTISPTTRPRWMFKREPSKKGRTQRLAPYLSNEVTRRPAVDAKTTRIVLVGISRRAARCTYSFSLRERLEQDPVIAQLDA